MPLVAGQGTGLGTALPSSLTLLSLARRGACASAQVGRDSLCQLFRSHLKSLR